MLHVVKGEDKMENRLRKTGSTTPKGEILITRETILKKQTDESFGVSSNNTINVPIPQVTSKLEIHPVAKVVEKDTRLRKHRR